MERTNRDIGGFLESLPQDARQDMMALDAAISETMAGLPKTLFEGKFWGGSDQEIIGYGTYTYRRSDKRQVEWFVVGLALQKSYISVYISAVEGREYVAEKYGREVGKVKVGKSSISFTSLDHIDLDTLLAIVAKARALTSGS